MNLTRDELAALASAIQSAWQAGSIRDPQTALFVLSGSEKLRREWERLSGPKEAEAEEEPPESSVAA